MIMVAIISFEGKDGVNSYNIQFMRALLSVDSSVGTATGYGLDDHGWWEFESRKGEKFSLLHIVQTSSGVNPTSCNIGTGGKAAGA
jgi:hypothetical protein